MINNDYTYKYLIVDAEWMLRKNWAKMIYSKFYTDSSLVKTFYYSIAKLLREEVKAEGVVLLWDRSPYHKQDILGELGDYKGDRVYESRDDITEDMSQEEKDRLEKASKDFELRIRVKYKIMTEFDKLGMTSISQKGYEADDIAYLLRYSNLFKDQEQKSIIASKDSDWVGRVNPDIDFYRLTNKREFHTYDSVVEAYKGMDPYLFMSIDEAIHGSHNNLVSTKVGKASTQEIKEMMDKDDYSFTSDKDRFIAQLKSFKVEDYPDWKKLIWKLDTFVPQATVMDSSQFQQYCLNNHMKISAKYYKNYVESLGKEIQ